MNEISPLGIARSAGVAGPQRMGRVDAERTASTAAVGDRADFSQAARLLSRLAELPDVRQDVVDRVRAEITAGTYDTAEKVEAILDEIYADLT